MQANWQGIFRFTADPRPAMLSQHAGEMFLTKIIKRRPTPSGEEEPKDTAASIIRHECLEATRCAADTTRSLHLVAVQQQAREVQQQRQNRESRITHPDGRGTRH